MSPPVQLVNLDEFERLLLTNWTSFINPQKMIALVLSKARDAEFPILKGTPPSQKSLKITISHFRADPNRTFMIWVDFVIPKPAGTAIGTCELRFDPLTGAIDHIQTLGNII